MAFAVSKIFWVAFQPANALLLMLVLGLLLVRWAPRLGRTLVAVSVLTLVTIAVLPVGPRLVGLLEDRFPPPAQLERVDGVIVLAGGVSPRLSAGRGHPVLQEASDRMTTMVSLSLRFPEAKLVFTGGSGQLGNPEAREAPWAQKFFASMGVDLSRLILEDESRNTWENAVYSKRRVEPRPEEHWLLVTSAIHMPRSVGCFRKAGWKISPYPVGYRTTGREPLFDINLLEGLRLVTAASKEWIGLAAYWAMGRTSELFPGPST